MRSGVYAESPGLEGGRHRCGGEDFEWNYSECPGQWPGWACREGCSAPASLSPESDAGVDRDRGGQGQGRGQLAALPPLSLPPAPSLGFIRAIPFFSFCAPFPNLRLCHPLDLLSFLFPLSNRPCLTSRLPQLRFRTAPDANLHFLPPLLPPCLSGSSWS